MSKQNIIFSLLFGFVFIWNGYLVYTTNNNFNDMSIAISATDCKVENFISSSNLEKIINTPTRRQNFFENNDELERRIQFLEYENNQQQSKLNDAERDALLTRLKVNEKEYHHGDLYNTVIRDDTNLMKP